MTKLARLLGSSLLVATALACNTPPKEPPRDGADAPAASAARAAPAPASSAAPPSASSSPSGAESAPSSAPASSARAPAPSASASAPSKGACAADADCRTWSSYCNEAPCACRVVARGEAEPRCLGPSSIRCLVDPCLNKVARCQSGACVLTAKGSAGATDK